MYQDRRLPKPPGGPVGVGMESLQQALAISTSQQAPWAAVSPAQCSVHLNFLAGENNLQVEKQVSLGGDGGKEEKGAVFSGYSWLSFPLKFLLVSTKGEDPLVLKARRVFSVHYRQTGQWRG